MVTSASAGTLDPETRSWDDQCVHRGYRIESGRNQM